MQNAITINKATPLNYFSTIKLFFTLFHSPLEMFYFSFNGKGKSDL